MQRTKSKILSILLSLVMLLSLLPTTALAAGNYPAANAVSVDGGKDFSSSLYYKNTDTAGNFTGTSTDYNAAYDPSTGTLTLSGYDGGRITLGGASDRDLTIKLIGNNTVTVGSDAGIVATSTGCNIIITADNGSSGKLTINATSGSGDAYGIGTGLASGAVSGNVTITGYADVTINATTSGSNDYSFGIYAAGKVAIEGHAKVAISAKAPSITVDDQVYGIYAKTNVTIDTAGEITVDASNADNEANVYSTGVNSMGTLTLTKAGRMTVKWKGNSGVPFYPRESFSDTDHAINVDKTNCYASYRFGTPHTVEVVNGTLTGPGVLNAKSSGKFLENDTVSITPYTEKGNSGETIPFKGWTSSDVTLSSPTTAANSFTVPNKDVTVTAKHDPFDGTPTFTPTGMTGTEGTLTFKTVVRLGDGTECFYLVKDGEQNDDSKYKDFRTDNSPSSSPYEYSYETRSLPGGNQVDEGDYYVVELLNGKYYLSEKFTVSYTAAPTPTASVDDVSIDGVKGSSITAAEVKITLTNDKFKAIAADTDVKGWFTNLPTDLDAKIKTVVNDNDTTATIEISGTPSVASSAELAITIPAANLVSNADLTVTSNANAKYNITAPATTITDLLVPVTDLTGKTYNESAQEPTFGGTLTRDTDYTVSYTVKPGGTGGALDGGKPKDAGTYVVTVAGKGGYTGSFTKDFEIGKATPVYTAPTVKTGLAYTGSPLELITKGSVSKGGEMQYKLDSGSYSTTIPTATNAGDYTVYYQITENDNYNAVAETQVGTGAINIAQVEWGVPTETLTPVNPTTAGGSDGQITGTTSTMQYKKSTDSGWADCSGNVTGLAAGTYFVRYMADSNHTASDTNYKTVTLTDPGTTLYGVTVTDGTAAPTGDQAAGAEVTITASTKTGFNFKEWTGLNDSDYKTGFTKASNPAIFTMPASNVNVTATYDPAALTGTASITGTLKFNEELTATLTGGNNTGTLTYKWYRGSDEIIGATGSTYTLVEDDIGKTITVKVSSTVQTGEIPSAATAAVDRADGPAAPTAFTLSFTLNSDGTTFTATIPTVAGGEYSFDGTNYSATNTKADCAANSSYTGYVRIAATSTHEASAATSSTQTSPKLTVATPTFTPNGVSGFTGPQSVTITCATTGAKIYYTTDDTTPTTASTLYTTALSLTSTTTVKAIAVKTDMNDSAIATATFTKYSGGGGGGGGVTTYAITVKSAKNGDVTASHKTASKGTAVTLTVDPDKGYVLDTLTVLDGKDKEIKLTEKNGKFTFTMPASKVTVAATFKASAPTGKNPFIDVPAGSYYEDAVVWAVEKGITSGTSAVTFDPNGNCTRAQAVTFLWRAAGSPAPKTSAMPFTDVPSGSYYYDAVLWAMEQGITKGTSDTAFSPNASCTRAQIVTFLWRANGSPVVSGNSAFTDVAADAYYAAAVAWAEKNGVTGGIGNGLFGSNNNCTRAQIVTFLYRAMK